LNIRPLEHPKEQFDQPAKTVQLADQFRRNIQHVGRQADLSVRRWPAAAAAILAAAHVRHGLDDHQPHGVIRPRVGGAALPQADDLIAENSLLAIRSGQLAFFEYFINRVVPRTADVAAAAIDDRIPQGELRVAAVGEVTPIRF